MRITSAINNDLAAHTDLPFDTEGIKVTRAESHPELFGGKPKMLRQIIGWL